MSSNTRSGSKRPGLRSSTTKLKIIDNQSNGSKSKGKRSPASRKNSLSAQVTASVSDVSKTDDNDVVPLEVDSKKNGSLKNFCLFENDSKNAVDIPTNDTEISPLRSNRVRFVIQTKRKKLAVVGESGTKRTRKYKENFNAFFEDSTKTVNSNHDDKLNLPLPPSEKNLQDSVQVNDQFPTSNNNEAFGHPFNIENKKESHAINSDTNSVSDMAAGILSSSVFQNEIPMQKSYSDVAKYPSEKKPKHCFVKSFDLIEETESGRVEHNVSKLKNAEFQQSQNRGLNRSSIGNKTQDLTKCSHVNINYIDLENTKQELNNGMNMEEELSRPNLKNVIQKLNDSSVENIDPKLSDINVEDINPKLNEADVSNMDIKLNEISIGTMDPQLNGTIVKKINSELCEIGMKNTEQELNRNSLGNPEQELKKISPENVTQELNDIVNVENKELELNFCVRITKQELKNDSVKNMEKMVNESSVADIEQGLNKNGVKTGEWEINKIDVENTEQELSNVSFQNVAQEFKFIFIENTNQELNATDMENTNQELNATDMENTNQELNATDMENTNQELNATDMENTNQELNATDMENTNQELNAICIENTNQDLNIISMENTDQDLNEINMSITDQELTEIDIGTMNRELNKISVRNAIQELNKFSVANIDQELSTSSIQKPEQEFNNSLENVDEKLNAHIVLSVILDLIEAVEQLNERSAEAAEQLNKSSPGPFNQSHMETVELNENHMEIMDQLCQKKLIDSLISEIQSRNAQELKMSEDKQCLYNFESIKENICRFNRKNYKNRKQVRRLLCDCTWHEDEYLPGIVGCGEECLNRILMIECGARCKVGDKCSNKRFQKREYAKTEPFETETKGIGLKISENVKIGSFIIEFMGELLNGPQFRQRVKQYAHENTEHHYFMALSNNEIIDATQMGNFSRFINHSCDPNCETQKWTVNGELRVGFFAKRDIKDGEELTFDYKFQIYGREAQKCFCGAEKCKGYIGEVKPILIDTSSGNKSTKARKKTEDKRREIFEDFSVEKEVEKLCENGCLRNREDTLLFARLMVRVEDVKTRQKLLDVILKTTEQACLRMFVDYHGLSLIWSWMVDGTDPNLRYKILEVLSALPVSNKTILIRSKVLKEVEKWSVVPINDAPNENMETDADNEDNPEHKFSEIVDLACKLLASWKLLKEAFRIPRVEEQKKSISPIDTDNNVQPKDCSEVASPKVSDESKGSEQTSKSKEEGRNKSSTASDSTENTFRSKKSPLSNIFGTKQTSINKNERRQLFAASVAQMFLSKQASVKDSTPGSGSPWTPGTPNGDHNTLLERPALLPTPVFTEPPPSCSASLQLPTTSPFPPPPSQQLPNVPPPLIFPPPNISVPPPQLPFLGVPPPPLPSASPSVVPIRPSSSWTVDPSSSSPAMYLPPLFPPPATGMNCPAQPPPAILPPYQSSPSTETGVPPFAPFANSQSSHVSCSQSSVGAMQVEDDSHLVPDENGYISLKIKLPTNWKAVGDGQGSIYFYHAISRKVQWHPPLFADESQEDSDSTPAEESQDSPELSVKASTSDDKSNKDEKLDDSVLPRNWKSTKDTEGQLYYYNVITRETQWDPPPHKKSKKDVQDEDEVEEYANIEEAVDEAANSTPLMDEPQCPKKRKKRKVPEKKEVEKEVVSPQQETSQEHHKRKSKKTPAKEVPSLPPPQEITPTQELTPTEEVTPTFETMSILPLGSPFENSPSQEADSSLGFKKIKDKFKAKLSAFVIRCLSHYRKPTCRKGKIVDVTDFRYLARKLTHCLIHKELRHCKNIEDLHYSEIVRNKAHDFIEKYMSRYGPLYKSDKNKQNQDET